MGEGGGKEGSSASAEGQEGKQPAISKASHATGNPQPAFVVSESQPCSALHGRKKARKLFEAPCDTHPPADKRRTDARAPAGGSLTGSRRGWCGQAKASERRRALRSTSYTFQTKNTETPRIVNRRGCTKKQQKNSGARMPRNTTRIGARTSCLPRADRYRGLTLSVGRSVELSKCVASRLMQSAGERTVCEEWARVGAVLVVEQLLRLVVRENSIL